MVAVCMVRYRTQTLFIGSSHFGKKEKLPIRCSRFLAFLKPIVIWILSETEQKNQGKKEKFLPGLPFYGILDIIIADFSAYIDGYIPLPWFA